MNHKGAILTINDRVTSRVWILKLPGKEAIPVAKITARALRIVKNLIQTITANNGKLRVSDNIKTCFNCTA
jgi:IS30 family transposase